MTYELIEADAEGARIPLTSAGRARCVSAAKHLLDALHTNDSFSAILAYERLTSIQREVRTEEEVRHDRDRAA